MGSRANLHDGWSSRLLEPEQSEEGNGEGMQLLTVMEDWLCIKFTYRERIIGARFLIFRKGNYKYGKGGG